MYLSTKGSYIDPARTQYMLRGSSRKSGYPSHPEEMHGDCNRILGAAVMDYVEP